MGDIAETDRDDRAIGALVGLAAGDAVGTTLEFQTPGTFTPLTDMVGGGPFALPVGSWTDDTSMAMCLAESILDTGALDPADQLRRYVLWWQNGYWSSTGRCFDIGLATMAALSRFAETGDVTDREVDQERAANGSAMRLAPVAIRWHTDPAEAAERSAASSLTTHAADRPVDVCRLLGAMTAALIRGDHPDEVLHPDFWTFGALHPEVEAVARGSWRAKEPPQIRGRGYCVDAIEAALWAVDGATTFRDAVLRAANLGDDADTTAAIAGQLAGARWGWSGIPEDWRAQLMAENRIRAIAGSLAHAEDAPGSEAGSWPHDDLLHAYWLTPGRVLAGEYPGDRDSCRRDEKVNLLVDHGVRTFVDLTTPKDPLSPYEASVHRVEAARGLDLSYMRCPIPDQSVVSAETYEDIVRSIHAAAERGVVYVHCWGGVGRTGTVAGCLFVEDGMTETEALDALQAARAGTRKAHRPAPENARQTEAIRIFAVRRRRDRGGDA